MAKAKAIKKVACPDGKEYPVSGKRELTFCNLIKGLSAWIKYFSNSVTARAPMLTKNTKVISFHFCFKSNQKYNS